MSLAVLILASLAARAAQPQWLDQGWTPQERAAFYAMDQGSRLIPLSWMAALRQSDGTPFLADRLVRYGYLPNDDSGNGRLPVGFTASGNTGAEVVGMTCAACHTRQIEVNGVSYRIDGGPAIVDFEKFLRDLDRAVGEVLADSNTFADFADAVLGGTSSTANREKLRQGVVTWWGRYHALIAGALPPSAQPLWGTGRVDAIGMILNRLTGLDLGQPPSYVIAENIMAADVPVRYPFLWNSPKQDETQWLGLADNGDNILALARNLGQVFGVFADFRPRKRPLLGIDYLTENSANFDGLEALERLVQQLRPPPWPWGVDPKLAAQGEAIFKKTAGEGGCADCHGVRLGKPRGGNLQTWYTPIRNVGTDSRQSKLLDRMAFTGVLKGAFTIPLAAPPLQGKDKALNVLKTSVIGSMAQHLLLGKAVGPIVDKPMLKLLAATPDTAGLKDALRTNLPRGAYEARVLEGIWAAAPYLHNGSVRSLAELLKPPAQRAASFKIGPAYDKSDIGLAAGQPPGSELKTTGCDDLDSGNSRCGHDYGTRLKEDEKKALLEYLKTL